MINNKENPAEWAMLVTELDEARQHLDELITVMTKTGEIDEKSEYTIYVGHIYAHLNRAWHLRNQQEDLSADCRLVFSQFPKDIDPVG